VCAGLKFQVPISSKRVNRGGGYGLEIPCEFHFTGDGFSIDWLKEKLKIIAGNYISMPPNTDTFTTDNALEV
jgi:hypothetical protein